MKSVQTCQGVGASRVEMFASHESFGDKHGIQLEENFNKLPTIHWLPRVHGGPYKFRYIVNSRSCSTKELSVRMTFVLQAIKTHVKKYCHKVYENSGVNLFWSIDNSLEVINAIKSKRNMVSEINTFDFSTLYTSLPLHLVKNKLIGLIEKTFAREKTTFIVVSRNKAFFSNSKFNNCLYWSCEDVCDILCFLLDNCLIKFGKDIFKQVTGIPMGANYAPLVADLFLFCYESEFMKNLSKSNDLNLIEKFNTSFRYLDDLCSLDNSLFHTYIKNIYPKELILLQSNNSDDKATFLELDVQINNLHCTIKIYDKRDDFDFNIVNFLHLDGNIPQSPSYGTYKMYLSQLIRFARVCNRLTPNSDFFP